MICKYNSHKSTPVYINSTCIIKLDSFNAIYNINVSMNIMDSIKTYNISYIMQELFPLIESTFKGNISIKQHTTTTC